MRVLQLNIHYKGTGADRCARELYEELPSAGIETAMWVSRRQPGDPPDIKAVQRNWERVLAPLEVLPDLTDWRHRGCIAKLRSLAPHFDLVHIHNIHSGAFSIRAIRDLTRDVPCVWTLHDEWAPNRGVTCNLTGKMSPEAVKQISRGLIRVVPYHRYHDNFKWRRTRHFLRTWLPQPSIVICPSRYMAELAEQATVFPDSEILHIPNGTRMPQIPEASMPRAAAKAHLNIESTKSVVLLASTDLAQAHKGAYLGISAIAEAARHHQITALLVGKAGRQLQEALRPVPAVCLCASDDATLARAYRAADITLIPSLAENFPYVALESLACGTPVVAFRVGGLPEIIGRNERGMICERFDAAEMSRHLTHLLSAGTIWQKMSQAGATWVRKTCGMNAYLDRIVGVYDRVLAQTGRHSFQITNNGNRTMEAAVRRV